jgi:peptide/nickel transport system permease protein
MWIRRVSRHVLAIAITLFIGGLLAATLVRFAPGFGVDERELDPRFREASLRALREAQAGDGNILQFYGRYLSGAVRGDLGVSRSLNRPVSALIAERFPVTLRSLGLSLVAAWLIGLVLALPGAMSRSPVYDAISSVLSGIFLCLPAAALALLLLWAGGTVPLVIALVVFPKLFRYLRNLLGKTYSSPHVLAARARGLGATRILLWHVLPFAGPELLALTGVSVSMALGATIPVEVICDSPGIGQLAFRAVLGRDLPLLVNLTILVAALTMAANSVADLATHAFTPRSS